MTIYTLAKSIDWYKQDENYFLENTLIRSNNIRGSKQPTVTAYEWKNELVYINNIRYVILRNNDTTLVVNNDILYRFLYSNSQAIHYLIPLNKISNELPDNLYISNFYNIGTLNDLDKYTWRHEHTFTNISLLHTILPGDLTQDKLIQIYRLVEIINNYQFKNTIPEYNIVHENNKYYVYYDIIKYWMGINVIKENSLCLLGLNYELDTKILYNYFLEPVKHYNIAIAFDDYISAETFIHNKKIIGTEYYYFTKQIPRGIAVKESNSIHLPHTSVVYGHYKIPAHQLYAAKRR